MDVDATDGEAPTAAQPTKVTLSPADRIAELNEIDKAVVQLLSSASEATSILANAHDENTSNLEAAQDKFTTASSDYFSTLSSIEVRLRRQVYALEEAGLIKSGTDRDTRRGRSLNADGDSLGSRGRAATGGGPLDPSWLNARVSNSVEMRKKKELLMDARALIERISAREGATEGRSKEDNMDEGEG